jgi:aminoglycoside phosphotransferase (APT) family kinase protein
MTVKARVADHTDGATVPGVDLGRLRDWLLDLGHLLATWPAQGPGALTELPDAPGLPSRSEMIEHYAQGSGRTVDNITWYQVLACYRLAVLLEGGHARARAGQTPDEVGETCRRGAAAQLHHARDLIAHRTEG